MFCNRCGKELEAGVTICTDCGEPVLNGINQQKIVPQDADFPASEENISKSAVATVADSEPYCNKDSNAKTENDNESASYKKIRNKASAKKAFKFRIKPLLPVIVIALVVIFAVSNFAYAKNAVMKLFMSPEEYFAYVVASGAEDLVNTFSENIDTAKGYVEKGVGEDTKIVLKKYDGLEALLFDIGQDDASEFIEWFRNASLTFDVNTKNNVSGTVIDAKLNDVELGEIKTVVDMNEKMTYLSIPEYAENYIGTKMDTGHGGNGEQTESIEKMKKIMSAMPDKNSAEKILTKYLKVVVDSIHEVDQNAKKITADGISQKVTSLSLDIDSKLIQKVSSNFLKELKGDRETREIVENVAEAVGKDASNLWKDLDKAIAEIGKLYEENRDFEISLDTLVNSKGEIVGFEVDTYGVTVEAYTTKKGNKFGVVVKVNTDKTTICIEGKGKQFNNKKTGEFELAVNENPTLVIEVTDFNTEKLKKGLFDGRITFRCEEDFEDLKYDADVVDPDVIEALSLLEFTFKSSQKSADKRNWKIYLEYDEDAAMEFEVKGSAKKAGNVKIPSDYIDANDSAKLEEWTKSINLDKFIEKMRDAEMPDETVDEMENNIKNNL